MATVFFLKLQALTRSGLRSFEGWKGELDRLGLTDGAPFIVDDEGRPVRYANDWLGKLATRSAPARRTAIAYARDYCAFHSFLEARGSDPLQASPDDIAAYHLARRIEPPGGKPALGRSSWARAVSALDNFYTWAIEQGLVTRSPFTYKTRRIRHTDGSHGYVRRNQAKEKTGRRHASIKWLESDRLSFLLDVGFSGLLPDGSPDPKFRGRHARRNRAMAELLVSSGLRIQEASLLAPIELPPAPERRTRLVRLTVPGGVAKGGTPRETIATPIALQRVHSYIAIERQLRTQHPASHASIGSEVDVAGLRVDGRRRRWASLTEQTRRTLRLDDGRPLAWPLTERGTAALEWGHTFASAVDRCRTFDPYFPTVTPHVLRHTFAVHTLRWLIADAAAATRRQAEDIPEEFWAPFWRQHDPLRTLQGWMGHASITTTQIYLDVIDATRLYISGMHEEADAA